ncbi:ABC transporter substrate-binding protein [Rhodococcus sp. ENV425]|uniref:ABC transporter substrate-binding protein n=1 Tax=Rhodococcus sp. ENV425 TaxID=2042960 RepID=UPI000C99DE35|nr:ABC transporter substrate-binding protein [Rhodococcus sp. ENV425]PND53226.1 ABC transporter substrate-binding protein [Rhodococcus sp. ENV425]
MRTPRRPASRTLRGAGIAVTALAAVLVAACTGTAPANRAADGDIVAGGTLRIASLASDMDSLDPLTGYDTNAWAVQRAITRQLVTFPGSANELKDDTELTPDLAESWDVSEDGRTYTFHLRDGITYSGSSTREIVAGDFVYAIERFCDPNKQVAAVNYFHLIFEGFTQFCSEFAKEPTGDLAASKRFIDTHDISGVRALDDKTLVITAPAKSYDFLDILTMNFVTPLPPEVASKYFGDSLEFRQNFPSSGPYRIDTYQPGQQLILKKVEGYNHDADPARKAYVDEIAIDFTANSEDSVVQKVQSGEADLTLYMDVPPRAVLNQYASTNNPNLHTSDSGAANFIVLNAKPEATFPGATALRDPRVRQALAYAVDKANLVQGQGGPIAAKPNGQIVTSTLLGHEPFDPYATPGSKGDPAKARQLLAEAGYPDGLTLDAVYRSTVQFESIAVTLKEDVAAAGITLNLTALPGTEYSAYLQDPGSRYDVALSGSFTPDWQGRSTRMLLGGWLNSEASPCGKGNVNAICYSNDRLNELARQAFPSVDPGPIWAEADRVVSTDLPWIPLFEKRKNLISSDRVTNWTWASLPAQADFTNIAIRPGA